MGEAAASDLRFGLTLANRGVLLGVTTPAALLALAERAEGSGWFDSVWVGDSLFAKPRLDALTLLAAIAGRTRRVLLGPACLASFPLRHPLVFAYEWASLDQISGGRAALIVCAILAAVFGLALVTGSRQVRVFIAVALTMGFVQTVFAATLVRYVSGQHYSSSFEDGSRYSVMPIMAMTAAAMVAVAAGLRRQAIAGGGERIPLVRRSPWALAAAALICVLALGWLSDFRYVTQRTSWGRWKPVAERMLTACQDSATGEITTWTWERKTITIPCSQLRR